jgi:uncharacterized membrane protein YbaN (DUF454 family)
MNTIYTFLGLLFVSFGVIGIFLPVWPTTPFILVSVFLFSRTNNRFDDYIMRNKWVGSHLKNYMENKKMDRSFKIKTTLFLWIGLSLSMLFSTNTTLIIILAMIGVAVSAHIWLLRES